MKHSAKLLFAGDVCFDVQPEVDATLSRRILAGVKPYFEAADLRILNLETPLADEGVGAPIPKSGPNIVGRPRNLAFLREAGADCAVLANNHAKDYGEEALLATMRLLDENGISHCGAGRDVEEAYRAWRAERNGIRFSLIAVCENEFGVAGVGRSGTAGFRWERLAAKIAEERDAADFVIVQFHGGNEFNPVPSPGARERYRLILRLGADAVVGGHPHCIQGFEFVGGRPIVYSLGNFLFKDSPPRSCDDPWHYGYLAELTATKGERLSLRAIPYRFDPDATFVEPFEGEERERMLAYIDRLSAIIPDDARLVALYNAWCSIKGVDYVRGLQAKPEYFAPGRRPADFAGLRDLLSCEAHNELLRTTLDIAFSGELEEAIANRGKILELQRMPV